MLYFLSWERCCGPFLYHLPPQKPFKARRHHAVCPGSEQRFILYHMLSEIQYAVPGGRLGPGENRQGGGAGGDYIGVFLWHQPPLAAFTRSRLPGWITLFFRLFHSLIFSGEVLCFRAMDQRESPRRTW